MYNLIYFKPTYFYILQSLFIDIFICTYIKILIYKIVYI